jgi:hypothetical protein
MIISTAAGITAARNSFERFTVFQTPLGGIDDAKLPAYFIEGLRVCPDYEPNQGLSRQSEFACVSPPTRGLIREIPTNPDSTSAEGYGVHMRVGGTSPQSERSAGCSREHGDGN